MGLLHPERSEAKSRDPRVDQGPSTSRLRCHARGARLLTALALFASISAEALEVPSYLGPKHKSPVRRIVTLAPSLTQTVIALGAGDRLVGVSRFDELPEVAKLPRVGGFVDPSIEAVVALGPDLVLVQPAPGNKRPVEKMGEVGLPVLVVPLHSVSATLEAMREIGRALGLPARAEALVKEIEEARASVRNRAKGQRPLRVLFIYGFEPLVVAGPGSFAAEFLVDAGAVNAATEAASAYSVYSAESLVRSRPDLIIDAANISFGWEKIAALPGIREARWTKTPSQELLHPGPNLARGLDVLFGLLYPKDAGQ